MATILEETNNALTTAADETKDKIGLLSNTIPEYTAPTQADLTATGVTVKDASSYSTPDTTVAGQLSKLLNSDSEYMKQVDAKSKMQANQLGMLSSDRYIGAATGAAIREGLPIATADAATASKFGLQQQQADNALSTTSMEGLVSGSLKSQDAAIQMNTQKTQGAIESYLQSAKDKDTVNLSVLNNDLNKTTQEALKNLDFNLNKALLTAEYSQKTAENARAQATSQIENTTISIENILKDPDILQLGSAAVAQLVNNQIGMMKSGIELTYNLAGLNVDGYVSTLLDTFTDTYDWSSVG